jgi:hypothetical protein
MVIKAVICLFILLATLPDCIYGKRTMRDRCGPI